jgi:hypothetical protein
MKRRQDGMIMQEKRNTIRYPASAQVQIGEKRKIALLLKDISITGCSLISSSGELEADAGGPVAADAYPEINREYTILISPEAESGVASFELTVEFCWSHIQDGAYEAGGLISGYPKGKQYQFFANYLVWRSANI